MSARNRTDFGVVRPSLYFTLPRSGFNDVTRSPQGEVRSGSDYPCPSDSNPYFWVCSFDAGTQTQAGIGAL